MLSQTSPTTSVVSTLPAWATVGERQRKYGKAKEMGADRETLSDEDLTDGFLDAKLLQGNDH